MDDASSVCSNFPTACYVFYETRDDNETKHWEELQDPARYATKRYYIVYNPLDAFIRQSFHPDHKDGYS